MHKDLSKFGILGKSAVMQGLAEKVSAAAPHWDSILLTGERGTGKELLAKAVHLLGPTRGASPVIIDCATLHTATVEATLFGYERGAFTGAVHRKIGFLEAAHQGTVFLDEISSLPLEAQGRLLRFLEEQTINRIGALTSIRIKTRIISATNRDLAVDMANGAFLPDLYDRLSVLNIESPPLRNRHGDLPMLLDHFIGADERTRFTKDCIKFLNEHPFYGNVRELRNLCRRLRVFHPKGRIDRNIVQKLLQTETKQSEISVMRSKDACEFSSYSG